MKSEEDVKEMLDRIETLSLGTPNEFTVRALRVILKVILELDAREDLSIMEGL